MLKKLFLKVKILFQRFHQQVWWESIMVVVAFLLIDFLISSNYFTGLRGGSMGPLNPVNGFWVQYDLSRMAQISSVVATTIATIASLVFSITIVSLMSVASNFSVRYVINVFNHQMIRLVLIIFIFTYCYALFFPFLDGKNEAVLAQKILFMFLLVLMCMGSLLFYIRYIIQSIQIDKICQYNSQRILIEFANEHVLLKEKKHDEQARPKLFQGEEYLITSQKNGFATFKLQVRHGLNFF